MQTHYWKVVREERGLANDLDPNMAANSNGDHDSQQNFSVSEGVTHRKSSNLDYLQ